MNFFDIDNRIIEASQKAMELCKSKLDEINDIQEYNQQKMIKAFQEAGVRESHFSGSTGYGYDDFGRHATAPITAPCLLSATVIATAARSFPSYNPRSRIVPWRSLWFIST